MLALVFKLQRLALGRVRGAIMISQDMAFAPIDDIGAITYPSLAGLSCPHCGADHFVPVRLSHRKLRMDMVMEDDSVQPVAFKPIEVQCLVCGRRFDAQPHDASAEERLAVPHTLTITREKNRLGGTVYVMLNGFAQCLPIENGETLQREINTKDVYIFVAGNTKRFDRQNAFHLSLTDLSPDPEVSFKFHPQFL